MVVKIDWLLNVINWFWGKVTRKNSHFVGITIWPWVFISSHWINDKTLIKHERIHLEQQKKYLVIGFFVRYIVEYFIGLIKYRSHFAAYYAISFERDAYEGAQGKAYYKNIKRVYGIT